MALLISPDGDLLRPPVPVGVGFGSAVASAGGDFFAVWTWDGAYGRLIRPDGTTGPLQALSASYSGHGSTFIDVASNGSDYLVTWSQPPPGSAATMIQARRVNREGQMQQAFTIDSAKPINDNPAVASDGRGYLVTYTTCDVQWARDGDIRAVRIDAAGAVGQTFSVESESRATAQSVIAFTGSRAVAAWVSFGSFADFFYDSRLRAQIRVGQVADPLSVPATASISTTWQEGPAGASVNGSTYLA